MLSYQKRYHHSSLINSHPKPIPVPSWNVTDAIGESLDPKTPGPFRQVDEDQTMWSIAAFWARLPNAETVRAHKSAADHIPRNCHLS